MSHTSIDCEGDERRQAVRRRNFNGLDYLEVSDDQYELYLYFLDRAPQDLMERNVRIEGGTQITGIKVVDVRTERGGEGEDDYVAVRVDRPGDFSTYTLRLVNLTREARIDPRHDHLHFSFKIDCPSDLDCKLICEEVPPHYDTPEINYLAKDYTGFRQLIFDRLALIMPNWKERHVSDLGIALVEVLAYVGDHLSYYQDAVATEAYLDTARQRISLRRHARLVDYLMHEGYNARAWLHLTVDGVDELELDLTMLYFITSLAGQPDVHPTQGNMIDRTALVGISHSQYEVFEPVITTAAKRTFYQTHNEIHFYTWGDERCCLPVGATHATLDGKLFTEDNEPDEPDEYDKHDKRDKRDKRDDVQSRRADVDPSSQEIVAQTNPPEPEPPPLPTKLWLQPGDILIFEENIGPETANPADADPRRRHAVRLTQVEAGFDPVYQKPVVEIEWCHEDALPFKLCLSAIGPAPECALLTDVSVARGNILLVDHGRRISDEDLGEVLLKEIRQHCEGDDCEGEPYPVDIERIPERFRPVLMERPLIFSQPPAAEGSAAMMMVQDARRALPNIWLTSLPWNPEGRTIGQADDTPTLETLARKIKDGTGYEGSYLRNLLNTETLDLIVAWYGTGDLPPATRDAVLDDLTVAWLAMPDLLSSERLDPHYVAEIDNDGRANLRFGDGTLGKHPPVGDRFMATYRIGAAPGGNVGAGALAHIVLRAGYSLSGVSLWARNPLPATPALPPESMDEVRLIAPFNYSAESQIQRAVATEDYAMLVERDFASRVQQAAAVLRWTGHCIEVLVVVDPFADVTDPDALLSEIWARLNRRYRRIGHDLVVRRAEYVPLDIKLEVCAMPGYARGDVKGALLKTLGRGEQPGGKLGFFHPDNLTFGGTIALSRLVAAAHSVPGVQSARVIHMRRAANIVQDNIPGGDVLTFGPLEIPRLDNDPGAPQNGVLEIIMKGGK